MKRVIIESPYAGDIASNSRYLRACLRDSLRRGEAPFASHAIYTQPGVLDDGEPTDREHGIKAGFAWRAAAEATVVYEDLGLSCGMRYGIEAAKSMDHPIEFRKLGPNWMKDLETKAYKLAGWDSFLEQLEAKMEVGAEEHPDTFSRPPMELVGEIQQECLDLAGWGFCLWTRLQSMKAKP